MDSISKEVYLYWYKFGHAEKVQIIKFNGNIVHGVEKICHEYEICMVGRSLERLLGIDEEKGNAKYMLSKDIRQMQLDMHYFVMRISIEELIGRSQSIFKRLKHKKISCSEVYICIRRLENKDSYE